MLDKIRLATPKEVKSITDEADLGPGSAVFALENPAGPTDLAVLRQTWELDPLFNRSGILQRKIALIWGLETWLRLQGAPAYYFSTGADTENGPWRATVVKLGAVPRHDSTEGPVPQICYKKVL